MSKLYIKSNNIVTRKIAGETILVPICRKASDMENIYVLNEVGSRIWELLDGKRGEREMREILVEEFEAPLMELEKDIASFISSLEEIGLVKTGE